jgi:hypothetical protein
MHDDDVPVPLSPSPRLFITQIGLAPILRRRADELRSRIFRSSSATGIGLQQ